MNDKKKFQRRYYNCTPLPSSPVPPSPVQSRPAPSRPVPSSAVQSRPAPSRPVWDALGQMYRNPETARRNRDGKERPQCGDMVLTHVDELQQTGVLLRLPLCFFFPPGTFRLPHQPLDRCFLTATLIWFQRAGNSPTSYEDMADSMTLDPGRNSRRPDTSHQNMSDALQNPVLACKFAR